MKKSKTGHVGLTEEKIVLKRDESKVTLSRIIAMIDLPNGVKKGALGGYVESIKNIRGYAWVGDEAFVYGDAIVEGLAQVMGNSEVSQNARIGGQVKLNDNVQVHGSANIHGNLSVMDNVKIYECASISGTGRIQQRAIIGGRGETNMFGSHFITDQVTIRGHSILLGSLSLRGHRKYINLQLNNRLTVEINPESLTHTELENL